MQGPGDNTSVDDPYIMYTGRTYNEALVAGIIRVEQGVRGCDLLCLHPLPGSSHVLLACSIMM